MRFMPTEIAGVTVLQAEVYEDERGWFAQTYVAKELPIPIARAALSFNPRRGTVRGLHFQAEPHPDAKLVSCPRGRIFDVAVDLRPGSPTRGRHVAVELSGPRSLHIPPGVAHGFQTLEDETIVSYLISEEYMPELARGVRWDDPSLNIAWPHREAVIISERDRNLPLLAELRDV